MKIITDAEAIRYILLEKDRYVCYLGAGASAEAGVMTAERICVEIRDQLWEQYSSGKGSDSGDERAKNIWAASKLNWNDSTRRYATCIKAYGEQAHRVQYFRRMLQGKNPSFCHHAVALLMAENHFKHICLTTNFDKMLESAFTQQGKIDCQPIRINDEVRYLQKEPNKCYVIKLHGDYDTYNISNTDEETIMINQNIIEKVESLLESSGMVVIGTAGHEKSIQRMFDQLIYNLGNARNVLDFGLLWGVYMGPQKPARMTGEELESALQEKVNKEVNRAVS